MKNLFILLLFPFLSLSQISGTLGNGTGDDSAALQAWINSGSSEVPVGTETYRITSTLNITSSGNQTLDFNGATILVGTELGSCIIADKPSGVTYINNLILDGDLKGEWGLRLNSSYDIDNVTVRDMYSNDQSVLGVWVRCNDNQNWTVAEMTNMHVENIRGDNNGVIGDTIGASRCIQISVSQNVGIDFLVEDSHFERATGEDGDVIFWQVTGFDNSNTNTRLVLNRSTFKYGTRRVVKLQGAAVYAYNSTFEGIDTSDPDMAFVRETGGFISMQSGTTCYNCYYLGSNFIFDGCIFNGSNFDNRIIGTEYSQDVVINNSQLNNGTEIRMWRRGGKYAITNNVASAGSKIYYVNDSPPYYWSGPILDTGNTNTPADWDSYSNGPGYPGGTYTPPTYTNPNTSVDNTPPVISSPSVTQINLTSFRFEWYANEGMTGQLSYGTTASYGSLTTFEPSYLTYHSQLVTGLSPGTEYHFTILGSDAASNALVDIDRTVTTILPPQEDGIRVNKKELKVNAISCGVYLGTIKIK